jgi:asparagine synthase (glutamine-hydrolysing)
MSGMAGIFYLDDSPVVKADLERMVNVLAHRGPDGSTLWQGDWVGFGHRMLWTTPESLHEKLPLVSQSGDLVLTADARIDNRAELLAALGWSDRPEGEISDSQLILAAYEKWGERCPEKLLGDFAFAIWDSRQQQVVCARDHFGVKPFYYYYRPGRVFVFASEIKALLCLAEVPRRLNEVRVADFLAPMLEDRAITFYQDILRLPPAQAMIVRRTEVQMRPYWFLGDPSELRLSCDEDYAEQFRELFTEAVRCRLRSAFPIGSTLSGGLDSSSVTCVARALLQEGGTQLHTFSSIFDAVPQCDERPFIQAVLERGGFVPHFIPGDQQGPLVDSDLVLWHHDEAFLGPNLYLPWRLNRAAQEAGVRVLLGGFDGDTTVSHGLAYLTELTYQGQWAAFAAEADELAKRANTTPLNILNSYGLVSLQELAHRWKWVAFARGVNQVSRYFNLSRRHLWLQHGVKPMIPKPVRQTWRKLRQRDEANGCGESIVNHSFARRIGMKARIRALDGSRSGPPLTLREEHRRSLSTGGLAYLLELNDRSAAAFSIEFRHPFMDKRLIEFCLALPSEQKIHQGWTRRVLRDAMAGIVPEPVRWRGTKINFHANFIYTLLTFERERLDEVLRTDLEPVAAYIDRQAVDRAYRRLTSQRDVRVDDAIAVWKAANLALWLRYTGLTPA